MDKLEQFYLSKETNFSRLLNALREAGIYSECSYPQIMALWENEDIPKLMIIGQEPYGWDASEESIKGLIAEYKRFNLAENYYNSPFWAWSWWIANELGFEGAHPFLWNDINKISAREGGRACAEATNLENTYFNLFQDELKVLNPEICIFLTGPNYDNDIRKKLPEVEFEEIDGFKFRQFAKLKHALLPEHSYRIYHPGWARGKSNEQLYYSLIAKIKELIYGGK